MAVLWAPSSAFDPFVKSLPAVPAGTHMLVAALRQRLPGLPGSNSHPRGAALALLPPPAPDRPATGTPC